MIEKIFSCKRCGFCCHGETTVSLTLKDQKRMIEALGISAEEVQKRYWRVTGNVVQMTIKDGHCIFYDDGCSIHTGRPERCRQWPLHPAILIDELNFHTIKESCPGINRDVSYVEFCKVMKESRMVVDQKEQQDAI